MNPEREALLKILDVLDSIAVALAGNNIGQKGYNVLTDNIKEIRSDIMMENVRDSFTEE